MASSMMKAHGLTGIVTSLCVLLFASFSKLNTFVWFGFRVLAAGLALVTCLTVGSGLLKCKLVSLILIQVHVGFTNSDTTDFNASTDQILYQKRDFLLKQQFWAFFKTQICFLFFRPLKIPRPQRRT